MTPVDTRVGEPAAAAGAKPAADAPAPAAAPRRGSRAHLATWLPRPTRRLLLLLAATVPAVLLIPAPMGLALALGVTAVAAIIDTVRASAPWTVPVARDLPRSLSLDAAGTVTWRVTDPTGRGLGVAIADELVPSLRAATRRVQLEVPAGGQAHASTSIRPARRGRIRPRILTVRTQGPWGLVTRQSDRALPGMIDVYPAFRSRDQVARLLADPRTVEAGRRRGWGRGGTELEGLREYRQGDELRLIEWSATARRGVPVVRETRPERNQTLQLLLDTGRLAAGLVDGVPRLDHAMDAAMALTAVATRLGDRVGLVAYGAGVRAVVPPAARRDRLADIVRAIFPLEPELAEADHRGGLTAALGRARRRSLLVLLTELDSEAVRETLEPALGLALRRHLVLVAAVRDPEIEAWAVRRPADVSEAHRTAAATRLLATRARTVERLRGRGALVVDAPPGELAGTLVHTYLEIKGAGRL